MGRSSLARAAWTRLSGDSIGSMMSALLGVSPGFRHGFAAAPRVGFIGEFVVVGVGLKAVDLIVLPHYVSGFLTCRCCHCRQKSPRTLLVSAVLRVSRSSVMFFSGYTAW